MRSYSPHSRLSKQGTAAHENLPRRRRPGTGPRAAIGAAGRRPGRGLGTPRGRRAALDRDRTIRRRAARPRPARRERHGAAAPVPHRRPDAADPRYHGARQSGGSPGRPRSRRRRFPRQALRRQRAAGAPARGGAARDRLDRIRRAGLEDQGPGAGRPQDGAHARRRDRGAVEDRSLFRRLLLGFMAVMLIIWLANLGLDMIETRTAKKRDMQRELRASALRILVVMQTIGDRPEQIAPMVRKMEKLHYALYSELGWYIPALQTQVWKDNRLVYQSADAGLPPTIADAGPNRQPLKDGWVVSIETDAASGVTVRMATEVIGEWMMQVSSIGYYFAPLLFSVPFLLIPAWFIIGVGLRPLKSIVGEIEERSATDLSPLAPSPYRELSPLVGSVNRLMERLTERLEREQEFLIDAAHELKTPLSIIQINAETLGTARTPERLEQAGRGLNSGVQRATHTVHQLLALARSGADRDNAALQELDLVELVCDRLALAGQIARTRGIEIELHAPERCVLPLHRESMASLVDNLVSNAVKYSHDGGRVSVCIVEEAGRVSLIVGDQGPGIPAELRAKVFERFFRLPGQDQPGSGLGLAIAERAALRNRGGIALSAGANGMGLRVTLVFERDPQLG